MRSGCKLHGNVEFSIFQGIWKMPHELRLKHLDPECGSRCC
jgi:hypothetical protein